MRRSGLQSFAADNDVEGSGDTDQAGQALRATRTGNDPQADLRKTDLRACIGDAVVAAQSDFETATERGAMQRSDDGFCAILQAVDDLAEERRLRRFAEL